MSLPEHHLDTVYTPGSIDEQTPAPPRSRVLASFLLPLFFVVAFVLCYSSALHAPKPHDLALTLAGPDATTAQIASGINKQAAGGFDITRTTSSSAATAAITDRTAVGAIVIGDGSTPTVTVLVASAGGQLAAQAVRQVGTTVAQQLGTTATVKDVVPTWSQDTTGSSLFYLVLLCTIGGYLTITVLFQAFPTARRRYRVLATVAAAVLTPLVALAVMSLSVGVYGADFGQLAAVAGIAMLYTLVVALVALFFSEILGQAAIFGVVLFCMALNFPSTGGTAPESMLPPAWQAVHAVWYGSGALEAFRSLIYFGGNGFAWPFVRVLLWIVGTALALVVLYALKARRANAAAPLPDQDATPAEPFAPAGAQAPALASAGAITG